MASSRNRQRALARAKAERQIARRAAQARRRRQWQAGIGGGVALLLLVLGVLWTTGAFKADPKKPDDCAWTAATGNSNLKDVGRPPTTGVPKSGTKNMTITTGVGAISAQLDLAKAPCTSASMSFLAGKGFFNDTTCHRLTTDGIFVLQCGDPTATGQGGPTYQFPEENVPPPAGTPDAEGRKPPVMYPRGTLAMANSGPGTNGSQFFLVYKDSQLPPDYTIFGTITAGLDVIEKIAAAGVAAGQEKPNDGKPATEVKIQSLTVSDTAPVPATTAPTSTGPSATPSANA